MQTSTFSPNPFNDLLRFETTFKSRSKITIYNQEEDEVLRTEVNSGDEINASSLIPGVYFCRIINDSSSELIKLFKQ